MNSSAFTFGEEMNNRVIRYILHPNLWAGFNPGINIDFNQWTSVKYLDATGANLDPSVDTVPNTDGGLYMFYLKCPMIVGITEYPLYIGRAQLTNSQNLRKRVKEYFQHWAKNNERPKITRMINYWGPDLYLAYLPLQANAVIINLEKDIINSTLFEMNDSIPDQDISQAVKAFNL
jgi:hypothetical protein